MSKAGVKGHLTFFLRGLEKPRELNKGLKCASLLNPPAFLSQLNSSFSLPGQQDTCSTSFMTRKISENVNSLG